MIHSSIIIWLLLASSCGLLSGCLGGTYNPSYFPFYLPPGDIIQTHAKPAGRGYFANFDPKAVKLEVTPTQVSNPTKTQQVLVATIFDADGTSFVVFEKADDYVSDPDGNAGARVACGVIIPAK